MAVAGSGKLCYDAAMRTYQGRVVEIQMDKAGQVAAWIACPASAIPSAGQYIVARLRSGCEAALGTHLFPSRITTEGFLAVASIPRTWSPGASLALTRPLGRGFNPPSSARRLALAALGDTPARLMPLAEAALTQDSAVALFTDAELPPLPASIEAYPLAALPEAIPWADFVALDLPIEALPTLAKRLGLADRQALPCPAQALVVTPMPCAGYACCGACAVPSPRLWKMACQDGPVFALNELDWRNA